jgi:hypothetical protein
MAINSQGSYLLSNQPHTGQQTAKGLAHHASCPAVKQVCKALGSAGKETKHYTYGSLAFGGLLFAAGAAAWSLPTLFVLFAIVCLPWRAVSFYKQKWVFYLIDFCYFVNIATLVYLLWFPDDERFESLVYAMADGPLAGALVAWQCPWVFGSGEHQVSVLMHLLPGLALFAHRYHTPPGLRGWRSISQYLPQLLRGSVTPTGQVPQLPPLTHCLLWLIVAPLLFYITWQLVYFVIVQVLCCSFIKQNGYDTSYTCLARRAAKTNNIWNRLVRRGSITRRILMYGLLQLVFTITCIMVFLPTYFSYQLAFVYQVVKVVFPVYYGSRYQMTKVPQQVFLKGMEVYHAVQRQTQEVVAAQPAPPNKVPAGLEAVAAAWHTAQAAGKGHSCAAEVALASHQVPLFRSQAVA